MRKAIPMDSTAKCIPFSDKSVDVVKRWPFTNNGGKGETGVIDGVVTVRTSVFSVHPQFGDKRDVAGDLIGDRW